MQNYFIEQNITDRLTDILRQVEAERILLVRGRKSFESCGAASVLDEVQKNSGIECLEFLDFSVNPKIEDVRKGLDYCKEKNVDAILAIGGGSAIDTAKLIKFYMSTDYGNTIPLVAVPTTAGTGAEATHFSVCYIDGEKQSIADPLILPNYAVIYPPFTYRNDAYLTACTGFDAVAQAIESYWSVRSSEESREFSIKALGLLWKQLPALMNNLSNEELRQAVAEGAYYAGRAINITTTTAAHAFSYKFTQLYSYPHGHAVAITFPFFFELNLNVENVRSEIDKNEYRERMSVLTDLLGYDVNKYGSLQEFMKQYIQSIGLSARPFTKEELKPVIESFNEQRAKNNPVDIDPKVKSLLELYLAE